MKYILIGVLLLVSLFSFGQEQWTTMNIGGKLNNDWSVAMEGEQRISYIMGKIRYLHYDFGVIRKVNDDLKIGFFYRELYEIKKGIKVNEVRPHIDAFYVATKHWKFRIRLEYQDKEIAEDVLRFRIRPNYDFKLFKNYDPYIQTELNFTKDGFTRNRFNAGVTINLGKFQIQPGYVSELLYTNSNFTNTNIIWVNNKINF
jgi:hypothetical protein